MDHTEALRFLDRHINLEATAGAIRGLSLDQMSSLVSVLGDPQNSFRVIHITGTNGKGSTARMITSLLVESGLSVGSYSSPHLQRINERIAWNGEPIGDDEFARVITELARLAPLSGTEPSYFELLTAGALLWFAENAVDVAVVEVGLLGRYDATNVCEADVAVVTNVGKDHTDGVGDWRQAIASEKAGIIKPQSFAVIGETDPTLVPVFAAEGARAMWTRGIDFDLIADQTAVGGHLIDVRTPHGRHEDIFLPLHGRHQALNASCAVAAVEAFFDRPLDADLVRDAFGSVVSPGRFEVVAHAPLVIIDGAHNPQGAAAASRTLEDEFDILGRRILVVGMLGGRDVAEMLDQLDARRADLVIACTPDSPRAVPASDVAAVARAMGVLTETIDDVGTAVARAIAVSTDVDAVLIAGSLYVAGAARTAIESLRS
ncbi:MAG: bifunctional folylpolyglutamate synthase/dihydrofolate synthase [Acidobacteria bacterium]|nr:bifunctional folylpolyglutamate synthase/dihydrofolate synthase [Acidobacteriota bacterium]